MERCGISAHAGPSYPAVKPKRVADPKNIGRCIIIEANSNMEIDLLGGCDAETRKWSLQGINTDALVAEFQTTF
jgi:hypothetical protein